MHLFEKRGFFLGLGSILAGAVILYLLFSSNSRSKEEDMPAPSPAITNTIPKETGSTLQESSSNSIVVAKNQSKQFFRYKNGVRIIESTIKTNSNGYIIEDYKLENGRTGRSIKPPDPIFTNPSDQVIALAISTEPGHSMPPLPDLHGIDEDFAKSLLSPIVINDTDPEDVKSLKKRVIETKKLLIEKIKEGETVQEALVEHQQEMERLSYSRLMAIREVQDIREREGQEMAQEFIERINKKFRSEGIPEIQVIEDKNQEGEDYE